MHVGVLRLPHEIDPVDFVAKVFLEAVEAVEIDAKATVGTIGGCLGLSGRRRNRAQRQDDEPRAASDHDRSL